MSILKSLWFKRKALGPKNVKLTQVDIPNGWTQVRMRNPSQRNPPKTRLQPGRRQHRKASLGTRERPDMRHAAFLPVYKPAFLSNNLSVIKFSIQSITYLRTDIRNHQRALALVTRVKNPFQISMHQSLT